MSVYQPSVSAVIRSYNVEHIIGETLNVLRNQDYAGAIEIILVDSGSEDRTLQIASPLVDQVLHLAPYIPGRALNHGISTATGELILTLSSDATPVGKDYLRTMVKPLLDGNVIASFGRQCARPDAGPSQSRDNETWFPPTPLTDPGSRYSAASSIIRRSLLEHFPFDESFRAAEDAEWAHRILQAGYQIAYVPTAFVLHSHSPSHRDIYSRAFRQRRTLYEVDAAKWKFDLWRALRFWLGISALDYVYALHHRYRISWYFHIPLYRLAQTWGLYRGAHPVK